SSALGYEAHANADDSVALGSNSIADEAGTVSVGSAGSERRIVNVADGALSSTSTDAINGRQLFGAMEATASALGGGAAVTAGGGFIAPTYVIQGGSYDNVGAALAALDTKVTEIDGRVVTLEGGSNTQNPASGNGSEPATSASNADIAKRGGADAGSGVDGRSNEAVANNSGGELDRTGNSSAGGVSTGGNQQVASVGTANARSEERRVGKECRCRW